MKPKVVIVEDEELARRRLRDLIAEDGVVELVGEAGDGAEAIDLIDALRPDLVLLDVDIPGPSGLEVLQEIDHDPAVIFTTAFDNFAIRAFDLAAVDYLLKPFSAERFHLAVRRAIGSRDADDGPDRGGVEAAGRARELLQAGPLRRLFVPDRSRIVPLPVEDVHRFEGRDDYVAVYDVDRTYLIRARLKDLEDRLDSRDFVRIHRSHIVNLNHVAALRPHDANRLQVEMSDGTRIVASRSRSVRLRQRMR